MSSYESVTRTVGSYESAWRGIRFLKKSKVSFIVKNALLPGNIEEQKAFDAWAQKIPWMDKPPGHSMFYYLRARRDDGVKNDRIRSLRLSPEKGLEVFFPKLRKIKASNPEYLQRCAKCFLHGLCEQCPGQSWMEHGTLDTPVEYQCSVAHAQARYLGLIGKNERAWEVKCWKKRINDLTSKIGGGYG